jgi:hypothetical protein
MDRGFSVLESLYYLINHVTAPLYTEIYKGAYFFIDYWSFNHFVSGLLIVFFWCHRRNRHPFVILGIVLFSWEFLEISFIYLAVHVFKPETLPDQFTDILVGFAGGLSGWLLWRHREHVNPLNLHRKHPALGRELFVSCAMSFCWVGAYGYVYNVSYFNSPVINWYAFLLWSGGLFVTILFYRFFSHRVRPVWTRVVLTWLTYFSLLLLIEYLGYYVLKIRQVTTEGPLLFGLIHGTVALKIYYIIAGVCAVAVSGFIKRVLPLCARERGCFMVSELSKGRETHQLH